MEANEKQLISDLFGRLSQAEQGAPPRDDEADRFIRESVSRQPGAPYYMAQTIIVQEQALQAAQARIQELEAQPRSSGGFLGGLFGGASQPAARAPAGRGYGAPQPSGPWNNAAAGAGAHGASGYGAAPGRGSFGGGGGGFLAGAAQTAVGVAGGVVLGSMLSDAFFGDDPAAAATDAVADAGAEAEAAGFEDMGGDDMGGFDEV